MVTKEETAKILGVCMDVFHELGSGFLEPVYQDAAEIAFRQAGIPFVREAQCPIYFRGVKINRNYEADFVCYGEVILEFKAVKCFAPEHKAQLINYLKATHIPLGYLINFHGDKLTWERIVYTPAESKPQTNADVPSLTLGQDKTAQALVQRSLRKSDRKSVV